MKKSKTKYSKFNKYFFDRVNRLKSLNYEALLKEAMLNSDYDAIQLMTNMRSFSEHGYENIFIETEELYDFLKDTKIITHGDISSQLYSAIENRKYARPSDLLEGITGYNELELKRYNFMVYGPINVINTALAVTLNVTNKEIEYLQKPNEHTKNKYRVNVASLFFNSLCFSGNMDYDTQRMLLAENAFKSKTNWPKKVDEDFHVIINMLFYMNAFPDYVYEGVPKRAIIDSEIFTKKRITITPNEKLFEEMKKSPHLRRGHFRTFSSDYYSNMKGKTIWIEPTFVMGNAVTVEDGISV